MISRYLAIAAAIAFLTAGTAGHVSAQQNSNPPAAAAPAAAPAQPGAANTGADTNPAPAATPAPAADVPAANTPPPVVNPPATGGGVGGNSPYGLVAFWQNGDFVIRTVIVILGVMSIGTWYIFF